MRKEGRNRKNRRKKRADEREVMKKEGRNLRVEVVRMRKEERRM